MVAAGHCVDKEGRYESFKRIVSRLIHSGPRGERRVPFADKDHERELIQMARGARKHYLGCFSRYRGAEGFGRVGGRDTPIPLTSMEKELLGSDHSMLPQWSPIFSNSENFWDNVNRQIRNRAHHSTQSQKRSSARRRLTHRMKSRS